MAGDEPVTSPDQHKPMNMKATRLGGIITMIALVAMALFGNHRGRVEEFWLIGIAFTIGVILLGDWLLRKNGLRN